MNQTMTLRIPDDLRTALKQLSEDENRPVSDLVRESLKRYIAVQQFRKLRKTTLPFAEAEGILTDEDVFKLVSLRLSWTRMYLLPHLPLADFVAQYMKLTSSSIKFILANFQVYGVKKTRMNLKHFSKKHLNLKIRRTIQLR